MKFKFLRFMKISNKPLAVFFLLAIAAVLLTACSSGAQETEQITEAAQEVSPPAQPAEATSAEMPAQPPKMGSTLPLIGTPWVLVMGNDSANPTVAEAGLIITAFFGSDGSLSGSGGCNNYNSTYAVNNDQLTINGPIGSTKMTCEKGMDEEAYFLANLEKVQSYQIDANNMLILSFDSGSEINEAFYFIPQRAPLEGTLWNLISLGPEDALQPPVAGANVVARFEQIPENPTGTVSGTTGCNDYSMAYYAGQSDMKINPPSKTENPGCAPEVIQQEQQYFQNLTNARSYFILGDQLQIRAEGFVLNFSSAPVEGQQGVEETPQGGPLTPLNGTKWWLVNLLGQTVIPGTEVTAEFAINPDGITGQLSGFGGCNNYSTAITGVFTVSPIATNLVFCAEPAGVSDQETIYINALSASQSINFAPGQLTITTAQGALVYTDVAPAAATEPVVPPAGTPVAVISGPIEGAVGAELTYDAFSSQSSVGIVGYSWDMGDGTLLVGDTVTHAYAAAGQYTVLLTVQDANGQIGQASIIVTIQ